jgi:hypothetical protein
MLVQDVDNAVTGDIFRFSDSVGDAGTVTITKTAAQRASKVLAFDTSGDLQADQEIGTHQGNWAASTAYAIRDIIKDTSNSNIYICNTVHTSSGSQPISSNTDVAKWTLIIDAASATTSATSAATSATASATSATASATSATASATSATASATSATAGATSATAAATSATAAATSYDNFDDRWLGSKSSDPSVDNDGATLLDGAAYFNTSNNVLMVYDLGGTTWNRTTPTSGDQTNINTLSAAAVITDMSILATADAVADMAILGTADVVADMAILGTADVVTDMNVLATADVVTDMNTLGTADVVADMNTLGTADVVADMNTLGTADVVADMNTLGTADVVADMNTLGTADVVTDMNVLGTADNVTAMSVCADNLTGINNFAARYRVDSSDPTGSLDEGDLAYNSTSNVLKYYNGSAWVTIVAGSLTDIVQDGSPQLGGNLDTQAYTLSNAALAQGGVFSNPNTVTGNTTVTTAALKNMFMMGQISVNDTYTWTIAGDGVLTII